MLATLPVKKSRTVSGLTDWLGAIPTEIGIVMPPFEAFVAASAATAGVILTGFVFKRLISYIDKGV